MSDLESLHEQIGVNVHFKVDEKHGGVEHYTKNDEEHRHCFVPNSIELPFGFPKAFVFLFAPTDHLTSCFDGHLLRDHGPFPK